MWNKAAIACLLALPAAGQGDSDELRLSRFEQTRQAMGTTARMVVHAPDEKSAAQAMDRAFDRIDEIEAIFSDYDAGSELSKIHARASTEPVRVSPTFHRLASVSLEVARATQGAFDPTAGPHTIHWRKARRTSKLPDAGEIERAMAAVGWEKMSLTEKPGHSMRFARPDMRLDFGGIAKGFAADEAMKLLEKLGLHSAMVAMAGDIRVSAPPPGRNAWRISLEALDGKERIIELKNAAVSTSGDKWQKVTTQDATYSHIIDPRTGLGLTVRRSVSVVAPSATLSDSLATALSVLGEDSSGLIEKAGATGWLIVERRGKEVLVSRSKLPSLIRKK